MGGGPLRCSPGIQAGALTGAPFGFAGTADTVPSASSSVTGLPHPPPTALLGVGGPLPPGSSSAAPSVPPAAVPTATSGGRIHCRSLLESGGRGTHPEAGKAYGIDRSDGRAVEDEGAPAEEAVAGRPEVLGAEGRAFSFGRGEPGAPDSLAVTGTATPTGVMSTSMSACCSAWRGSSTTSSSGRTSWVPRQVRHTWSVSA